MKPGLFWMSVWRRNGRAWKSPTRRKTSSPRGDIVVGDVFPEGEGERELLFSKG